ncbi:N-acetylglucosamine-6-phosphate deacetylase [Propionispira raffinosivorans]|uniref:N-acetylglucosamine-6-phosphate deacetylase n=1 Tax=Propionispira raffinosivorans TaxID=86959 RepID=UPI00036A5A33|nr:N-acetylglucosamine-6-phosphate deacetylase [Propionispira raffinosivorans]
MKAIINGKIILDDQILTGQVLLYNETIEKIIPEIFFSADSVDLVIDAEGKYVSAGFINLHIHGCCGFDTMDDTPEALDTIREGMTQSGVTAFLPTTMTYDFPTIYRSFDQIRAAMGKKMGAQILGCHVEGPFISEVYKGAQSSKYIIAPDFSYLEPYKDIIKIVTIAPEKLVGDRFINECKKNHIVVSMGHSSATYEEAMAAIAAGVGQVTHLFNGLQPLHHRRPSVVGAALDTAVNCEIIADNVHVHPAMQRLVYKIKGKEQLILITDSMRACMLPDGESELGGQVVIVKDQIARLRDGTIAGSVLTMNEAIRRFWLNTGVPLQDVIRLVTINPAKELLIYDKMGSIAVGKEANLTIFDDNIFISQTIVEGGVVYQQDSNKK